MTEGEPRPPTAIELIIQRLDRGWGDIRLWRSIISQALKDLYSTDKSIRMEAIEWFLKCGIDYRKVCENANITHWRLRNEVLQEMKLVPLAN